MTVEEEIKLMIKEINEISIGLETDFLEEGKDYKWLPFLGWWWRDLDSDGAFGMAKPPGEIWWIDQAHKWDFNYYWFDQRKPEELEKKKVITEKILVMTRAIKDYIETTEKLLGKGKTYRE